MLAKDASCEAFEYKSNSRPCRCCENSDDGMVEFGWNVYEKNNGATFVDYTLINEYALIPMINDVMTWSTI